VSKLRISVVLTTVAALLNSAPVLAAMVFGSIRQSGQPLANASLQLNCPWGVVSAMTDGNGGYRLVTDQTGSCSLTVSTTNAGSASTNVDFYDEPARYDFEFVGNGQLLLQ